MLSSHPWTFYKIDLNTGEIHYTRDTVTTALHVIGDRIFFYDAESGERVYTMNFDGSDVERFH